MRIFSGIFMGMRFFSMAGAAVLSIQSWAAPAACVVCVMAQPGQQQVADLESKYGVPIAEIMQKMEGSPERIKQLRLSLEETRRQSGLLQAACKAEKSKLSSAFKSADSLATCKAFFETGGWERRQEILLNAESLALVKRQWAEAQRRHTSIARAKVDSGVSVAAVNSDPEVQRWRTLVRSLDSKKTDLEREYSRLNEEFKVSKDSPSEDRVEGILSRFRIKGGQYKPECYARLDEDTAKMVGCMMGATASAN